MHIAWGVLPLTKKMPKLQKKQGNKIEIKLEISELLKKNNAK